MPASPADLSFKEFPTWITASRTKNTNYEEIEVGVDADSVSFYLEQQYTNDRDSGRDLHIDVSHEDARTLCEFLCRKLYGE